MGKIVELHDPEIVSVRDFLDWLYEEGPDPNSVPREKLLAAYLAWREAQ